MTYPVKAPTTTFAEAFVIESAKIENQTIPLDQVRDSGHMAAYQQMLLLADSGDELRQQDLKNWQKMIGSEQHRWGDHPLTPDMLGQFREHNIGLGMPDGSVKPIGAEWTKVQDEIDDLWDLVVQPRGGYGTGYVWSKKWQTYSPLEQAAIVHHMYERVHPFPDGNGRTGRLLALYILRRATEPPVLFTNWDKHGSYYPCFPEKQPDKMIDYFHTHRQPILALPGEPDGWS